MNIRFHTNLDLAQRDVQNLNWDHIDGGHFSNKFPGIVPQKGDLIKFSFEKPGKFYSDKFFYELEVRGIRYDFATATVSVELHMPSYYSSMSIAQWEEWFKRHRGISC